MRIRKTPLQDFEIAVCKQVLAFRTRTGMNQHQFARMVGVDWRSIQRWESQSFCPRLPQIERLRELERLWANLDTRDRLTPITFADERKPKQSRLLPPQKTRFYAPRVLARVIREVCGGKVTLPFREVSGAVKGPKVQMTIDKESGELSAWVKSRNGERRVECQPSR